MPMTPGKDKARGRCLRKHRRNRIKELAHALTLDEPPGEQHVEAIVHRSSFRDMPRGVRVIDTITNDADASTDRTAVVLDQVALVACERDDALCAPNETVLNLPLRQAFGRAVSDFVLGAIERVHGVDDRCARRLSNRKRDMRQPEDMHVEDIGSPGARKADRLVDRVDVFCGIDEHALIASEARRLVNGRLRPVRRAGTGADQQDRHVQAGAH